MEKSKVSLEETLLPALVQCFGIIFIGYVLGKTKVLKPTQAQGLSCFIQYLSLPALIFVTVSTIPLAKVKWEFIAAVFVSKACIFISVALLTILLTRPHDLGKAGIFAISATQSNDFALGYPLFVTLYQNTHPEYPTYLYIIAPIQLLVLNTVGFFLLEVEKQSNGCRKKNFLCHLIKGTLQNPVVIMTILGLVWNLAYGQKVLPILDNILKAFSAAFPSTALLLVGYTMTTRNRRSGSRVSLSILPLILIKNLILPIILQKFSTFMLQKSSAKEIQSLSSFAFLYGTIPTAPTVYVFATQYNTCVDVVSKTIIGSTLFSAPFMFSSASVISLSQIGIENVSFYISQTISYVSCGNLFCCFWLFFILCVGKRWKSISFGVTFYLVLAQFLMSIGGILLFFAQAGCDSTMCNSLFYAQYILTTGSMFSTRISIFLLAILLLIIRMRSLCFVLQIRKQINALSILICFLLPYGITASLVSFKDDQAYEPNFQLGYAQVIETFTVTLICLVGTVICVVLQQIFFKKNNQTNESINSTFYQNSHLEETNSQDSECVPKTSNLRSLCNEKTDIEDIGKILLEDNNTEVDFMSSDRVCDSHYQCSAAQRIQCSVEVSRYIDENNQIGTGLIDDEYFFKHMILLILLCVAMMLSLSVCFWKLVLEAVNGIFIELEFLDIIVNYSVGVIYFIMLGFESNILKEIQCRLVFRKRNTLAPTEESPCSC